MAAFDYQFNTLLGIVSLVLLGVKLFAFADAVARPAQAYPAADKLTKAAWLWITGLSFAAHLLFPSLFGLLSIAGTVASFVYILDVRPALIEVTRRR